MSIQELRIADIRTDGGTQPRAQLDMATLIEYTEAMQNGATFPPVTVYYDGDAYWLADGFHRLHAAQDAGRGTLAAEVRQGTRRDAVLYSVGANAAHGLRRTNADKRRAVETLLADSEWRQWSDREIARRAAVDFKTVGNIRRELTVEIPQSRKGADGRTINTANIGAKPTIPQPTTPWQPRTEWEPPADEYSDGGEDAYEDEADNAPDTVSMADISHAIADARKETSHFQSVAFTSLLMKLDEHRAVSERAIEAWLDVTPPEQWVVASSNFNRLRAFMDDVERRMNERKSPRLRVIQ